MDWTKEIPTQEGYYWYCHRVGWEPAIHTINQWRIDGAFTIASIGWEVGDARLGGYWYGPLTPPAPPQEPINEG